MLSALNILHDFYRRGIRVWIGDDGELAVRSPGGNGLLWSDLTKVLAYKTALVELLQLETSPHCGCGRPKNPEDPPHYLRGRPCIPLDFFLRYEEPSDDMSSLAMSCDDAEEV